MDTHRSVSMALVRVLLSLALLFLPGLAPAQDRQDRYREWLERDVAYIITPDERAVFLKLTTAAERDGFIEQFWLRRDPGPATSVNEFKEEHYRRIAYANEWFGSGIPGWKTDRGRIYILHGEPAEVESHTAGGTYERPRSEGGGRTSTFPFEIWRYRHIAGIGQDIEIEFVDKTLTGNYTIALDPSEKDALLRIPGAGKTLLEEAGAASKTDRVLGVNQQQTFLQMGKSARDQPFERLLQRADLHRPPPIRLTQLRQLVTTRVHYQDIALGVAWEHIWIDDARVLVPITLSVPAAALTYREAGPDRGRQASVQLYGRITSLDGRIAAEFEDERSFAPTAQAGAFLLQRQVLIAPGRYRLELVLKDAIGDKVGSAAGGLVIPTDRLGASKISSLMLARRIEVVREPSAGDEAFLFGDLRVVPAPEARFPAASQMGVYFQVQGAPQPADDGPPVELTYQIRRQDQVLDEVIDRQGLTIHSQGNGRVIAFAFLSLRRLSPGGYTLVVTCRQRDGGEITATRDFQVI